MPRPKTSSGCPGLFIFATGQGLGFLVAVVRRWGVIIAAKEHVIVRRENAAITTIAAS